MSLRPLLSIYSALSSEDETSHAEELVRYQFGYMVSCSQSLANLPRLPVSSYLCRTNIWYTDSVLYLSKPQCCYLRHLSVFSSVVRSQTSSDHVKS